MNKEYEDMRIYFSVLYRQFQIYINNNTKDLGIGASEYIFIMEIYRNDNISQEELSKNLIIDTAATARAIKSLEEKEYIIRKKDKKDKRTNRIELTKKGIEIKDRLSKLLEEWGDTVTKDMDKETIELVLGIIKEMSKKAIDKNKIQ